MLSEFGVSKPPYLFSEVCRPQTDESAKIAFLMRVIPSRADRDRDLGGAPDLPVAGSVTHLINARQSRVGEWSIAAAVAGLRNGKATTPDWHPLLLA